MNNERAVSEVVGFVLVFSLIVATIGIVYTTGLGGLQDTRDVEQVNNAERAFDVLADNFQTLARGNAPRRATEVKLSDSQLDFGPQRQVGINSSTTLNVVAEPQSIRYKPSNTNSEVVYEAGAVIRVDAKSAVMVREPDFLLRDRGVIRIISPRREGSDSIGGDTTVLIRSTAGPSSIGYSTSTVDSDEHVFIDTAPERSDVWLAYFESTAAIDSCKGLQDIDENTVRVECKLNLESLTVTRTNVDVEFT